MLNHQGLPRTDSSGAMTASIVGCTWNAPRFQQSADDPMHDGFTIAITLMLAVGVFGATCAAYTVIIRERRQKARRPSVRLLEEISRAHRLSFFQRRLVREVVRRTEPEHPGLIAVFPQSFDQLSVKAKLRPRELRRWNNIRDRFFGHSSLQNAAIENAQA